MQKMTDQEIAFRASVLALMGLNAVLWTTVVTQIVANSVPVWWR